jgi:nucleoside-diphosphate-sugar epimerase
MNILISGTSGFIGKNLINIIKKSSIHEDNEFILLSSNTVLGFKCIEHKGYTFTKNDFQDRDIFNIDMVIHIGAFIPKSSLEANDIELSYSNIRNTMHLINNLPNIPRYFTYISTIDVYEETDELIDESFNCKPSSLYGWSKLATEEFVKEYAKQNHIVYKILRLGHIYGRGEEKYKKLIPVVINNVLENVSPKLYGNPSLKRSFMHVNDVCNAIIRTIEYSELNGIFNIVSEKSNTIYDIVSKIITLADKHLEIEVVKTEGDSRNFHFDNSKMRKYLITEKIILEEGLLDEINYMKKKKGEFSD